MPHLESSRRNVSETSCYTCFTITAIAMKTIWPFWWKGSNSREKLISPRIWCPLTNKTNSCNQYFCLYGILSPLPLTRLHFFSHEHSNLIKAIELMAKLAPYCTVINIQIPFWEREKLLEKNIFHIQILIFIVTNEQENKKPMRFNRFLEWLNEHCRSSHSHHKFIFLLSYRFRWRTM